jgi:hypothetical protein
MIGRLAELAGGGGGLTDSGLESSAAPPSPSCLPEAGPRAIGAGGSQRWESGAPEAWRNRRPGWLQDHPLFGHLDLGRRIDRQSQRERVSEPRLEVE